MTDPIAIWLFPEEGLAFWSLSCDENPKIRNYEAYLLLQKAVMDSAIDRNIPAAISQMCVRSMLCELNSHELSNTAANRKQVI